MGSRYCSSGSPHPAPVETASSPQSAAACFLSFKRSEKQQIPGPKSPHYLIFCYFIFMKLLFKLHWPKQLTEIITTSASKSPLQALQLLPHCQCSAASLRACCVALQIVSTDLICRLKFLLQTRPLIIKKCFHGFICEQTKQLMLLRLSLILQVSSSLPTTPWQRCRSHFCGLLICLAVCRNGSSSSSR